MISGFLGGAFIGFRIREKDAGLSAALADLVIACEDSAVLSVIALTVSACRSFFVAVILPSVMLLRPMPELALRKARLETGSNVGHAVRRGIKGASRHDYSDALFVPEVQSKIDYRKHLFPCGQSSCLDR